MPQYLCPDPCHPTLESIEVGPESTKAKRGVPGLAWINPGMGTNDPSIGTKLLGQTSMDSGANASAGLPGPTSMDLGASISVLSLSLDGSGLGHGLWGLETGCQDQPLALGNMIVRDPSKSFGVPSRTFANLSLASMDQGPSAEYLGHKHWVLEPGFCRLELDLNGLGLGHWGSNHSTRISSSAIVDSSGGLSELGNGIGC